MYFVDYSFKVDLERMKTKTCYIHALCFAPLKRILVMVCADMRRETRLVVWLPPALV